VISAQVSERDPYGQEHILPSQPLRLNPEQTRALEKITAAMDHFHAEGGVRNAESSPAEREVRSAESTPSAAGELPLGFSALRSGSSGLSTSPPLRAAARALGAPHSTFLLHGVTGSGKTEIYLQAIAHALQQGKGAIVLVPEISLTPQTVERFKARFSSGPLRTLVAV